MVGIRVRGRPQGEDVLGEGASLEHLQESGTLARTTSGGFVSSGWKGIWKAMSPVFGLSLPDPWHSGRDSGMRSEMLNCCGTVRWASHVTSPGLGLPDL